jgi:hypothetical protein
MAPEEMAGARVAGYRVRRYENRRKGQSVTVLLVCGRAGPVSVHTPDLCYPDAGYELIEGPVHVALGPSVVSSVSSAKSPGPGAQFQAGTFGKSSVTGETAGALRIIWGWNATGAWQAPDNPRWSFARYPALYKLYVVRETRARESFRPEEDPCVDFLKVFLPELDWGLFPAP